MSSRDNCLGLIGLLNNGGRTLIGDTIEGKYHKLALVVLADDAAASTREKIQTKSYAYGFELLGDIDKATLGHAIGYDQLSYIGILDKKAAKKLKENWKGE